MKQAKRQLAGSGEALPAGAIAGAPLSYRYTSMPLRSYSAIQTGIIPPAGVYMGYIWFTCGDYVTTPSITQVLVRAEIASGTGQLTCPVGFNQTPDASYGGTAISGINVSTPVYFRTDGTASITLLSLLSGSSAGSNAYGLFLIRIA